MPKSKKENIEEITLDPIEEKVKEPAPVEEPIEEPVEPEAIEEGEDITEPDEFIEPEEGEQGEDVEFDEEAGDEETDEDAPEEDAPPFLGLMLGAKNAPVSEDPDPQSRIEALLWHIINNTTTDAEPQSRNEAILTAIANSGTYTAEAQSRIEALLIAILNHEEVDITPISRNEAILKAIANSGEYDEEPQSRNEELLLKWLEAWGIVIETATGAIANFNTSLVLPLINVKAEIKALETGTGAKSPSNPYVISGFTGAVLTQSGVNLWDEEIELGSIDNTTGQNTVNANTFRTVGYVRVFPQMKVYVAKPDGQILGFRYYDINKGYVSPFALVNSGVVKIPNNVYYLRFVNVSSNTYGNDISINYPSTATAYKPYSDTKYTVSWQTEAGEVFGGYYDFTTGKLVVTHVKLTETQLRSVNWSIGGSNNNLFGALLGNEYVYPTGANEKGDILSDIYENVGYTTINTATQAYQIALRNDGTIHIKDDRYATLQDFKDDLGNLNIIVKLETPVEYDLTPQQISALLGVNNIWNDTNGDTTVEYEKKRND